MFIDEYASSLIMPGCIRRPHWERALMSSRFAIIRPCVLAVIGSVFGSVTLTTPVVTANPAAASKTPISVAKVGQMWKEDYTVEYTGALPGTWRMGISRPESYWGNPQLGG
jgi:hypothetical protein